MFRATAKKNAQLQNEGLQTLNYAIKFNVIFDELQQMQKRKTYGCTNFVFNNYKYLRDRRYKETGDNFSLEEYKWYLVHILKESEEFGFLKEIDKFALETAAEQLDDAYYRFFKKQTGFPKYKSKKNQKHSYTTKYTNGNIAFVKQDGGYYVKLPKMKFVRVQLKKESAVISKLLSGSVRILSATVSTIAGLDFVSLNLEEIIPQVRPLSVVDASKVCAGDLGIKTLVDLYDGNSHQQVENPKYIRRNSKKLKRLQQAYSRTQKDSKNQEKAKNQIAKLQLHTANQRKDFNHKLSRCIADENQVYVSEDLNIKGMIKNRKLAKEISSCGWGQLNSFIKYKIERNGGYFIKVDRFYPSSKKCIHCGNVNHELTLSDRVWTCPVCGAALDRDGNASENLRLEGLVILKEKGVAVV